MKQFDKLVLIWLTSILIMFLVLGCQTQEPEFSILGKWTNAEWYCNQCSGSYGVGSTIEFEITAIDPQGNVTMTEGDIMNPSCTGNCTQHPWQVITATFVNNSLQVEWHTGHIFTGELFGNEFVGEIEYIRPSISYLFNDDIVLSRK